MGLSPETKGETALYQVLYRKWRPKTFAEVVGQRHITTVLKNELKSSRVAHAYLFTGSRGTGKTTCAKILAKAVNCLDLQDGEPCGVCENCTGIEDGTIMDVVEIDAASNNGVDNIRDLREESNFTPSVAKYRVYIIDEVHMLSIGAFNALLKTLEEPPLHVVFILATTEVHKLPATILSRCQRFDFHRIEPKEMLERLSFVAEQEGYSLDSDAGLLIAGLADGALRDALSLLDRCTGKSKRITVDMVVDIAGLVGDRYLFELVDLIALRDTSSIINLLNELNSQSKDMLRLFEELIFRFRNIMLISIMKDSRNMMVVTEADYGRLCEQAKKFEIPVVMRIMDILGEAMQKAGKGLDAKTELELALIRICYPYTDSSKEALLSRVEDLENALLSGKPKGSLQLVEPGKLSTPKLKQEASQKQKPEASKTDNPSSFPEWQKVLEALSSRSKPLYTSLLRASAEIRGDFLFLSGSPLTESILKNKDKMDVLQKIVREVTGKQYIVKLKADEAQGDRASVPSEEKDALASFLDTVNQKNIEINIKD